MKDHAPAILFAGVAGLGLSIAMLVDGFAKQKKKKETVNTAVQTDFNETEKKKVKWYTEIPENKEKEEEEKEEEEKEEEKEEDDEEQKKTKHKKKHMQIVTITTNNDDADDVPPLLSPQVIEMLMEDEHEESSETNTTSSLETQDKGLLASIKKAYRVSFAATDSAIDAVLKQKTKT